MRATADDLVRSLWGRTGIEPGRAGDGFVIQSSGAMLAYG
jgi:hypothetical protein